MQREHLGRGVLGAINQKEAELAASYHDVLLGDPVLAENTYQHLFDGHSEHDIIFKGRPICNVLRPRFISPARFAHLEEVSSTVARVFERAGDLLLSSDRMLDLIGASEAERDIWAIDPGFPGYTHTSRLDAFMVAGQPRFVEYNAESPAGIGYTDCLAGIFSRMPIMSRWAHGGRAEPLNGRYHLLETMRWAYDQWGGSGAPSIVIIDWENVVTRRDFELCAAYFREHGAPTVIADPRRLRYREGKLWLDDTHVDLVYRRVLLHELLDHADELGDLLAAYRDGAVCMVNNPRSKLLHKKIVMALLSDPAFPLDMSDEERAVVDASIPWTRALTPGTTDYRGRAVDLGRCLLDSRESLVLKPVDDYGGRGVVLGWETSAEAWEQAVESNLDNGYVVQERVEQPQSDFPFWEDHAVDIAPMLLDTNPLLFRGHMGSILTRISGSALLNVTAGTGSTTPTFVVREE